MKYLFNRDQTGKKSRQELQWIFLPLWVNSKTHDFLPKSCFHEKRSCLKSAPYEFWIY